LSSQRAPSRRLDTPEPGYFLIRMVRKGPLVPCAIFHEFGVWRAEFAGAAQGETHSDPLYADGVTRIWNGFVERISRDDYLRLSGLAKNPAHPSSRPREAVNLSQRERF
jgi:hypothetical protein